MRAQATFHSADASAAARRSPLAPILVVISAVLLITGVLPRWWYATGAGGNEGGHADLGLVAAVDCESGSDPDECMTIDYASMGGSPDEFQDYATWGKRTYLLGIVTAAMLGLGCVLWIARVHVPASARAVGAAGAVGVAVLALRTIASKPIPSAHLSAGFAITVVGAALGVVAGALLGRDGARAHRERAGA